MNEFMLIFRSPDYHHAALSPQDMQNRMVQWQKWIADLAEQGNFISTSRLGFESKVVGKGGLITDGPFTELKEVVGGSMVILAHSLDHAAQIAKGCPLLEYGGKAEVRSIMNLKV